MSKPPQHNQDLDARLEAARAAFKEAGIKVTHQRLEIFREVAASPDHPDVETVYRALRARLPTISLDTVYRTLWLLADLGLIATLGLPRERYRFDANTRPHHHFVCARCGLTADFYSDDLDCLRLPSALADFGKVEQVQVEARGICKKCAKEQGT